MGFNSGFKGLMYRLDYRGGKMDFSFSEVSRPAQCPDLLSVPPASKSMNTGGYFPESEAAGA